MSRATGHPVGRAARCRQPFVVSSSVCRPGIRTTLVVDRERGRHRRCRWTLSIPLSDNAAVARRRGQRTERPRESYTVQHRPLVLGGDTSVRHMRETSVFSHIDEESHLFATAYYLSFSCECPFMRFPYNKPFRILDSSRIFSLKTTTSPLWSLFGIDRAKLSTSAYTLLGIR